MALGRGIYLIPNREIKNALPNAQLLKPVDAYYVDWSPNGKEIAYNTDKGIFLFDILTNKVSQIIKDGYYPVFSPDGKQLAFLTRAKPTKIGIITFTNRQNFKHIELEEDWKRPPSYLSWSPDGSYLTYTYPSRNHSWNFAVPIAGAPPEEFLEMYAGGVPLFEWTQTAKAVAHTVEPTNKLTTLWGKLKQQDLK